MKTKFLASVAAMALAGGAYAEEIYSTDFESDDGGWTATADWDPVGDWAHGEYNFSDYTGGYNPPPAANSGSSLWGTVLHGDYTNAGGTSSLTQRFDFSGHSNVTLEFANWVEVFYAFDLATVVVNNSVVYERLTSDPPAAWEVVSVDLSAFDGMSSVDISFDLYATTVVERAGWYVDDIVIAGDPIRPCLDLQIDNLVAGEQATFRITEGTPGAKAATVYGFIPGETMVNGNGGYCATFGFKGVSMNRIVGGLNRTFDGSGAIRFQVGVPNGTTGTRVMFQSAQSGTCPDECMSEVRGKVVG